MVFVSVTTFGEEQKSVDNGVICLHLKISYCLCYDQKGDNLKAQSKYTHFCNCSLGIKNYLLLTRHPCKARNKETKGIKSLEINLKMSALIFSPLYMVYLFFPGNILHTHWSQLLNWATTAAQAIKAYQDMRKGGGYMNAPFTIHNTMCAARQGCEIKTPHCVLYHWHCEWLLSNSEEGKKSLCNKTLYNCYCSRDGSCAAKD